jgi:PAS domain S-box-containing protein
MSDDGAAHYRLLFARSPEPAIVYDIDGGALLEANDEALTLYGHTHDEMLTLIVGDLRPERDAGTAGTANESPDGHPRAERHRRRDGSAIDVETSCREIEFGGRRARLMVVRDVTQRARTVSLLHDMRQSLQHAQSMGQMGHWTANLAERTIYVSREGARMVGLPDTGFYRFEDVLAVVYPDDLAAVETALGGLLGGSPLDLRHRIVVNGSVRWLHTRAGVVPNGQECPVRAVGMSQDISERMQTELALRHAQERLSLAIRGGELATWDWDTQTGALHVNDRWSHMLGYSPADVKPRVDSWFELVHNDDLPDVRRALDANLDGVTPAYESEHRLRHSSGRWVWVLSKGTVTERLPDGRAGRLVGTHLDITARKTSEIQAERAMLGTVESILRMLEFRDPTIARHQRRVADLVVEIGREMNLSPAHIKGLRITGSLHDIGMISVPAEILSRPARLGPIELSLLRDHPQAGYEILKGIDFGWPVAEAVLQHHERLDGNGYPSGLKGAEIVFDARLLAVADVVEAISSHRPYRAALGIDHALAEIARGRSIIYDGAVADACLRLFRDRQYVMPD